MSEYEPGTNLRISWPIVIMYGLVSVMTYIAMYFGEYPGTWGWIISRIILGMIIIFLVLMVIAANVARIKHRPMKAR